MKKENSSQNFQGKKKNKPIYFLTFKSIGNSMIGNKLEISQDYDLSSQLYALICISERKSLQ